MAGVRWRPKEEYWVALTLQRLLAQETTMEEAIPYLRTKLPDRSPDAIRAKMERLMGTRDGPKD